MSDRRPLRGYTALVLAGRRGGEDRLAAETGAPHRALLDIHGVPMLERVLRTLLDTPCIGQVIVSIDAPQLLDQFPGIVGLRDGPRARVHVVRASGSPSRSVLEVLDDGPPDQPVLITTADHPLLTVEMVEHFLAAAEEKGGDLAAGFVASAPLLERFPEARRTYLRFRDERYSGANLFALQTPKARRAVEFFENAESYRKRPWRLVATFGLSPLVNFLLRRLSLDEGLAEISGSLGARFVAVSMPWAEAAVDVDKPSDLTLVREILSEEKDDPPDQSERLPSPAKPPVPAS